MSFQYIKDYYGKTFFKGQRVLALGKKGTVYKATNYIHVLLDGKKVAQPYHPGDVEDALCETAVPEDGK